MSDQVSSAVASEVVCRATSFLTGKCSEYKSVDERIDRLDMLRIKIKSAVEVSEGLDINIEPLHEWQEKLKEALSEAEETLGNFKAEMLREKTNRTIEGGSFSCDQSMQEEGYTYDDATLVHPASNLREAVTSQADLEAKLHLATTLKHLFYRVLGLLHQTTDSPWPAIIERLSAFARVLDPRTFSLMNPRMMLDKYLENDEKVSNLIKTVEKLEKTAGDLGDFIELLKLQSKRRMSRKRKRSARPRRCRGFFLVVSLKLQTYALFRYEEDPHLLVIKRFHANCNVTTGINSHIFIRFIV